jgi:hypothetical protein
MLEPNILSDEQSQDDAMMQGDPSFERLMQLVFSRPIYLEPADEPESESSEEENETETGGEAQPQ